MVNLKRQRKKRAARTQAFLRHLAHKKEERELLGSPRTEDWMIEFHQDILQNIEFALIDDYRRNRVIDDAAIAEVSRPRSVRNFPSPRRRSRCWTL